MSIADTMMTRRSAVALGATAMGAVALAGCSSQQNAPAPTTSGDKSATALDAGAFDALIARGPVADAAVVDANAWAKRVKDAKALRVGCVRTATLFSLLNETDGHIRGFDAGLFQLLTRYILGDSEAYEPTQVTSDTRESVLQNDQVDTVFATYSITDKRKALISFAGPYFTSKQGILVSSNNSTINGVSDLAGKIVAAQSGSTGPSIVEQYAPQATVQEFSTDEEARTALEQGRVDAYVIDATIHMSSVVGNPGKYRLLDETFGPEDNYGIGLPLNSDGVAFVNEFLTQIEHEGIWADLWKICIGNRTGLTEVPNPPAISA